MFLFPQHFLPSEPCLVLAPGGDQGPSPTHEQHTSCSLRVQTLKKKVGGVCPWVEGAACAQKGSRQLSSEVGPGVSPATGLWSLLSSLTLRALSKRADEELSWLWVPTLEMWRPHPTFYGLWLGLNDPFPLKDSLGLSCYFGLRKYNRSMSSPQVFLALTCLSHPQWNTDTASPHHSTFLFNGPPFHLLLSDLPEP